MKGTRRWAAVASAWFVCASLWPAGLWAAEDLAARVIILANSEDPDSLRIARHYAEVRRVPAAFQEPSNSRHSPDAGNGDSVFPSQAPTAIARATKQTFPSD